MLVDENFSTQKNYQTAGPFETLVGCFGFETAGDEQVDIRTLKHLEKRLGTNRAA